MLNGWTNDLFSLLICICMKSFGTQKKSVASNLLKWGHLLHWGSSCGGKSQVSSSENRGGLHAKRHLCIAVVTESCIQEPVHLESGAAVRPLKRMVCYSVIFQCRSILGTAEEEWGFRTALSALYNEQGKPVHQGAPRYLCHSAVVVHAPCTVEPIT